MIKMICDFCQNDVRELITIKVPVCNKPTAYSKGGVKLIEWADGNIVPEEKDICSICARRMMKALALMNMMNDD